MKTMNTRPRISWHRIRNFAAIVRSPAPVRDAFTGHPLLRGWWKCILALHGKSVGDGQLAPEHWNCVADGFRFYGWLYRFVAVALLAMAAWAAVTGLAGVYWLGFMIAGAFGLWCAAGLAFAGASDLPRAVQEGIWKLVVFLFLVALFLVSILMGISVEANGRGQPIGWFGRVHWFSSLQIPSSVCVRAPALGFMCARRFAFADFELPALDAQLSRHGDWHSAEEAARQGEAEV